MTVIRQTYLSKKAARECWIHKLVLDAAVKRLVDTGVFSKEEVAVKDLSLSSVTDSIRWDYIRDFVEEDQKTELIPLAQSYFSRHRKEEEMLNPQRFIAQGNGKKTAGYASVIPTNDHLVIRRLKQRKALSEGHGKAFCDLLQRVNTMREICGLPPVYEQTVLTVDGKGEAA